MTECNGNKESQKAGPGPSQKKPRKAKNLCASKLEEGRVDAVGPANAVGARKGLCRRRELPKSGARGGGGAVKQPRCGASSACRVGGEALTEVRACVNRRRERQACAGSARFKMCRERPAPDESGPGQLRLSARMKDARPPSPRAWGRGRPVPGQSPVPPCRSTVPVH